MKLLFVAAFMFFGCSNTLNKSDSIELRVRLLEERFNILDHKVDSLESIPVKN